MAAVSRDSSLSMLPKGCFDDPKTHVFYKFPEVCAIARKSPSSLKRAIARGDFPAPVKTGPRSIVFTAESIAKWQQDCINASQSK